MSSDQFKAVGIATVKELDEVPKPWEKRDTRPTRRTKQRGKAKNTLSQPVIMMESQQQQAPKKGV